MPMQADDIKAMIIDALPDADVTIKDLAGDGDHYSAHVISSAFKGKTRVAQHRLINEAIANEFTRGLHALSIEIRV
jgi:stress-induced morphogen